MDHVKSEGNELLSNGTAQQHLREAELLFNKKLFAEAISACSACLELDPAVSKAVKLRAQASMALKDLVAAVSSFEHYRAMQPNDPLGHQDLAVAYARSGDNALAVESFKMALKFQEDLYGSVAGLARSLVKINALDEAEVTFKRYLDIKPDDNGMKLDLINLYVRTKRFNDALVLGQELAAEGSVHPNLHRDLARAFRGLGQLDEAAKHFSEFSVLRPNDPSGHHELGRSFRVLGRNEAALESLRHALFLDPNRYDIHLDLGRVLNVMDRPDEAEHHFQTLIKLAPTEMSAYLELARLLTRQERGKDALALLRRAGLANPGDPRIFREMAQVHRQRGQIRSADAAFRKALSISKSEPGIMQDYGRFLLATRRPKRALAIFKMAAESDPNRSGLQRNIASCLMALDRSEAAEPLLRAEVARDPKHLANHLDLIRLLWQSGQATEADAAFAAACATLGAHEGLLKEHVKGKIRARNWQDAASILRDLLSSDPNNFFALLQSVRIAITARQYDRAKSACSHLINLYPNDLEAQHEWGRVNMETGGADKAKEIFSAIIERQPDHFQSYYRLSQLETRNVNIVRAVELLSHALTLVPNNVGYLLDRGRLWLSLNQIDHARTDAERALALQPNNLKAKQIVNAAEEVSRETAPLRVFAVLRCRPRSGQALAALLGEVTEVLDWTFLSSTGIDPANGALDDQTLTAALDGSGDATWLAIGHESDAAILTNRLGSPEQSQALQRVEAIYGIVTLEGLIGEKSLTVFRRELIQLFALMAQNDKVSISTLLNRNIDLIRRLTISPSGEMKRLPPSVPAAAIGRVFLVSRHGIELYGGGEHFLRGMAGLYQERGFDPVIVGMRSDTTVRRSGEQDGLAFTDVAPFPEEILSLALAKRPTIIHVLSGLGYEIITPLKFFHIATVYGTHFWRDMFEEIGSYRNLEDTAIPRREFNHIIRGSTAIYSNSKYTDEIKRKHFGVATPVIYSLNKDTEQPPVDGGEFALLINARVEKGFDLVLEVAALVPHIPFMVVASQSPVAQAQEAIEAAGLHNIKVVEKVPDPESLYYQSKVVLVPSYAFRETFSRVVIEAQRFGLPVIGSDQGNVPYLLTEAGVSLPQEPELWARELRRLYGEPAYYQKRRQLALENSERYAFSGQMARLGRLIGFLQKRILVGVGAGIGNIVQTSPLIRRLAEHFGRPVDVVINQDFPDCAHLISGSPFVNMVFTLDSNVVRREYDLVYLSHSFGSLIPPFNSNRVVAARHYYDFMATRDIHESEFNLFCANKLLDIPYEQKDAAKYFVGGFERPALLGGYIGIHSGGKGGEWEEGSWLNKRWPYFRELTAALTALNYTVASFGVPSEYVPGSVDMTGTPLAESILNIAKCDYFVGNDSGLMHVADALGVPLTTIFGPTSVTKNGPLAPTSTVVELQKSCAPCQFDPERFATCVCIAEVSLKRVLDSVIRSIANCSLQMVSSDA